MGIPNRLYLLSCAQPEWKFLVTKCWCFCCVNISERIIGAGLIAGLALSGFAAAPANANPEYFEVELLATVDSGDGELGAEIPTYHAASQRLFATNGAANTIDVYDLSNPSAPKRIKQISLDAHGDGITSVAAGAKVIAVAMTRDAEYSASGIPTAQNGRIVVLDTDGKVLSSVDAGGVLPDAITFTPNGLTAVVAIEAEPVCALDDAATEANEAEDYSLADDAEGKVAIVNLSNPAKPKVYTADFKGFTVEEVEALNIAVNDTVNNVAKDFEPEYVTAVSNSLAYVTIQEANAIAEVNLNSATITRIFNAGNTDRSEVAIDASDKDDSAALRTYRNVYSVAQPDTIASYGLHLDSYLVTANEGDSREYDCLDDDARVKDLDVDLSEFFSGHLADDRLGRAKVDPNLGDVDGDGDYDQLYLRGGRSISIHKNGSLVWDSGTLFDELQTAAFGENTSGQWELSEDGSEWSFEAQSRADDKGVEPEGIAVGTTGNRRVAIVGLERMSALVFLDITDATNPTVISWEQMAPLETTAYADAKAISPEGVLFIPAWKSPNGKPLVITSYELSGTLTVHQITETGATPEDETPAKAWTKRMTDGSTAKMYATYVAGQEVIFKLNGKQIAKLTPNDDGKQVRTVTLKEGKNRLEVFIDGERVKAVSYTK